MMLDWLAYAVARLAFGALEMLPWNTGRSVARSLGHVAYLLDRGSRKATAVANLQRAFPAMSRSEAKRVLRRVYSNFLGAILDGLQVRRFIGHWPLDRLVEVKGMDKLDGLPEKTGVVFVTGHFGCWEVLGLCGSALGGTLWTVARMFDNVFAQRHVQRLRESAGQRMLPKEGAFRHMVRLVREGRNVALLMDQDVRRHGVFVDFFGRPASTTPAAARIALRTGAPVAFVYARQVPGRNRFRVVLKDVVWPRPGADRRKEVRRITQRITGDLEEVVREAPDEWLWLHRRWKTYPGKYAGR